MDVEHPHLAVYLDFKKTKNGEYTTHTVTLVSTEYTYPCIMDTAPYIIAPVLASNL